MAIPLYNASPHQSCQAVHLQHDRVLVQLAARKNATVKPASCNNFAISSSMYNFVLAILIQIRN